MIDDKLKARRILKKLYEYVWAYTVPKKDDLKIRQASSSSLYGEITFASLEKILDYLNLGPKDVFFDLGSGVGKVVLQVGMTTRVKRVVGVELASSRCKEAKKVLAIAVKEKYLSPKKCEFRNEDILKADLSKATVLYSCSTAFPGTFMKKLAKKLRELEKPLRIVTLQELPENSGFELVDKFYLDMSWIRKTTVYIFIPALTDE